MEFKRQEIGLNQHKILLLSHNWSHWPVLGITLWEGYEEFGEDAERRLLEWIWGCGFLPRPVDGAAETKEAEKRFSSV